MKGQESKIVLQVSPELRESLEEAGRIMHADSESDEIIELIRMGLSACKSEADQGNAPNSHLR